MSCSISSEHTKLPAEISQSEFSFHTSSKKLLFVADKDYSRDPQLVKIQGVSGHGMPNPNLYIHNITTMKVWEWKDLKS